MRQRPISTALLCAVVLTARLPASDYDLILRGGRVVDGSGAPWYRADIGVRDGRIARIGKLDGAAAERTIDAAGLVVAPGFVDLMGQSATSFLAGPEAAVNLFTQGVTTIHCGEGGSAAPLAGREAARHGWSTMREYLQLLELRGMPINIVQNIGHTQVRSLVLGDTDRAPSAAELDAMRALVREAMEAGASGLSTALIYPPAVYATTDEIAELARAAGERGGRYYTHLRNEGDRLLEAIDEALDIGEKAGAAVHIFHLKAAGRANWPAMDRAVSRLRSARAAGREVTADIYPYVHNGLGIEAFIHPRHFAAGRDALVARLGDAALRSEIRAEMETGEGWENWYRHAGRDWDRVIIGSIDDPAFAEHHGRSLAAIAAARGEDAWDTFFRLVAAGAFALPETMSEADKIRLMGEDFVSFCTDVGPAGGSAISSHPRAWGAFPRVLGRYSRDLGAITLEHAVARAAAAAANVVHVRDRGRIAEGLAADLVVFDAERIADRATFAEPSKSSEGIVHVIVNGELVLEAGRFTGALPGRVLRGPGYSDATAPWNVTTGEIDPRLASFDRAVRGFMERHSVPGAALAVVDRGRLVLARGYGYADLATLEPAGPRSLFRIASISKPITAAAVLRLVERGSLSLDAPALELLGLEPEPGFEERFDQRQRRITVRMLLEHRGGFDRDASFDPMFQSVRFARELGVEAPAGVHDIIRAMMRRPLDFEPGERYAYSNYGYALLGRIIEKVSGRPYEAYVRDEILAPVGIRTMQIGKTRAGGRVPGEVRYYDPHPAESVFAADLGEPCPGPYGAWHLEAMDAHGGWIASAVDLVRFAAALGDGQASPLLSSASLRAMAERPEGSAGHGADGQPSRSYYSLGWMNELREEAGRTDSWHTGSLDGTSTLLYRRGDGRCWAVLLNSRFSRHGGRPSAELLKSLNAAADAVAEWPDIDLFPQYR